MDSTLDMLKGLDQKEKKQFEDWYRRKMNKLRHKLNRRKANYMRQEEEADNELPSR